MRKLLIALCACAALVPTVAHANDVKAKDAAEVGDNVILAYPNSSVLCASHDDAEKVHMVGFLTLAKTYDEDSHQWQH